MTARRSWRVFAFLGEEDLLVEEAIAQVVDAHLPPEERTLGLDRLYADEVGIDEILVRADTLPFFGGERVVVVRNVDRLPAASQDRLAAYLEAGPPPTVLVLTATALDRRRRLYAVLRRVAEVREFGRMDTKGLVRELTRRAQGLGKRLAPEAAQALVGRAGPSLRALVHELGKLAAYVGDRAEIGLEDVLEAATSGAEVSVFRLVDAIAEGDTPQALRWLNSLLTTEHPVGLVALIASHFRALLVTQALGCRASPERVRAALGNRAWQYRHYLAQLDRMGDADLPAAFEALREADLALKTTTLPPRVVLERLVVRLGRLTSWPSGSPA